MLRATALLGLAVLVCADDATPVGIVRYSITGVSAPWADLGRRQEVDLLKQQNGSSYLIQLGIGTPPQKIKVQLDTGSTDLWVNPICNRQSSAVNKNYCFTLPTFSSGESSTFKDLGSSFDISYGSGNATIEWVADSIDVGGSNIKAQQFGIAKTSYNEPFGILGIGPKLSGSHPSYSYFIDSLASQGLTNSRAFSLDLRGIDSPDSSIIFGGVDTKKFNGSLEKFAIIPVSEETDGDRYWITLDSINVSSAAGTSTSLSLAKTIVLLDSGSTLSQLPGPAVRAIAQTFGSPRLDAASGLYIVSCNLKRQAGSIDFNFGSKTIKVAIKDFLWQYDTSNCVLGVRSTTLDSGISILGDTFLRAAYVVFDQDNRNIHLAQAAECGTNLVPIGKGADAVPSSTGECPMPAFTGATSTSSTSSTRRSSTRTTKSTSSSLHTRSTQTTLILATALPTLTTDSAESTTQATPITTATVVETPSSTNPGVLSPQSTSQGSAAPSSTRAAGGPRRPAANAGLGIVVAVAAALL